MYELYFNLLFRYHSLNHLFYWLFLLQTAKKTTVFELKKKSMVSISISKCPILLPPPPPKKKQTTYNRKKKCHTVTKSGTFKIYCLDEPYFKNPENYADRKHRKLKQTSANPQLSVLTKNKIKWDINYSHVQTNCAFWQRTQRHAWGIRDLSLSPYVVLPNIA